LALLAQRVGDPERPAGCGLAVRPAALERPAPER